MTTVWRPRWAGHTTDETKCRAGVWERGSGGFYSSQCSRKAVVQENGYGWCRQHAPSSVKKREEAREAKRAARWADEDEKWAKRGAREEVAAAAIGFCRQELTFDDLKAVFDKWDALP